jgi:hypothetical protein
LAWHLWPCSGDSCAGIHQEHEISRAARRSSSAQTSAMRPDMTMRPTLVRACPASITRTTRSGLRTVIDETVDCVALESGATNSGAIGWTVRLGGAAARSVDERLVAHHRIRLCSGPKTPKLANKAIFMVVDFVRVYMSMVLRIRPTARPSISKGSPGSTTIVW